MIVFRGARICIYVITVWVCDKILFVHVCLPLSKSVVVVSWLDEVGDPTILGNEFMGSGDWKGAQIGGKFTKKIGYKKQQS